MKQELIDSRNNFLQIIVNAPEMEDLSKEEKQKRITYIMKDVEDSGIFDPISMDFNDLDELEMLADVIFGKSSKKEIKEIIKSIYVKESNEFVVNISEEQIKRKRIELAEDPRSSIVLTEEDLAEVKEIENNGIPPRYGRSPLHEAISLRDLDSIKRYVKEGKYLNIVDNNGNTPFEMAFQIGDREAIKILRNVS